MKIILMIIFMILSIFNNLIALDFKNYNAMEFVTGTSKGKIQGRNYNKQGYFIYINSFNDVYFNQYFFITSTLNYTKHTELYSRAYNKIIQNESYVELSELVINLKLTKDDILSTGIISFKNGVFSEHSRIGLKQSDALMTLYYLNMNGIFYTHYINRDNKIQIGYGKRIDKLYALPEDRYEHSREGSSVMYLFTSHKFNKHTIKLNVSTSNIMYKKVYSNNVEKLGRLNIAGLGYQYDDRDDTGNLFYSIFGVSQTKFDSRKISPTGTALSGPGFKFSEEKSKIGYSILLGMKKDFDAIIFKKDVYVGIEYFHASKKWVSYTTDTQTVGYYSWGHLGNFYKLYTGINITPKLKLGVAFHIEQYNYSKISGGNNYKKIDDKAEQLHFRLDILF